ncbi:ALF repeat-containing protein [Streptomyces sp. NBC_01166]|uniref:ALF repeat-containing protein n=1 Tax=Streptomyces sp. NBC_01166 TaxID=2903755 RepID=UPI0038633BD6|nr:ALF repeat-containing protein [Streptomyces sp. NBC_01166]
MRHTRAALTVAATALAPALLLAGPAFATGPVSSPAHVAVSPAVVVLETPVDEMSDDDVRVTLSRILADPDSGRRVIREINALLDNGTPEEMRTWLETGYRLAQAEDDRVAIVSILNRPGISDALRAAVQEAIDGTPEEMRYFLEYGQYEVDA